MDVNNQQVGGDHYKNDQGMQHWDMVLRCMGGRYLEGNLTKYISRHRQKNGLQDLRKARHYALKIKEQYMSGYVVPPTSTWHMVREAEKFCIERDFEIAEHMIVMLTMSWRCAEDLDIIIARIDTLIQEETTEQARIQSIKAGATSKE